MTRFTDSDWHLVDMMALYGIRYLAGSRIAAEILREIREDWG